jgi:6-phosphofructokinase 1
VVIWVPERAVAVGRLLERLQALRRAGRRSAMVAVAEGVRLFDHGTPLSSQERDEFGEYRTGGVGALIAKLVQEHMGWEARGVVLGHLQRAGSPIAFDRVFALRLGAKAARLVLEQRFGRMASLRNGELVDVPLAEAVAERKKLSDVFLDRYEGFFLD